MTLALGTVAARALLFAATPVLSRLYTPEDFGVMALFLSLFAPLLALGGLRYEGAVLLPKEDEDAVACVHIALGWVVVIATVVAALILLGAGDLLDLVSGGDALRAYLGLLPLALLAGGFYQVIYHWALRKDILGRIAWTRVVQSVLMVAVQVAWPWLAAGPGGLMLGHVIGTASGSSSLVAVALKTHRRALLNPDEARIRAMAYAYRRFALFTAPGSFISALCLQFPPLALAFLFDQGTVGTYALTATLLGVPQTLVGLAAGQLFMRDFAARLHTDPEWIQPAFWRMSRYLGLVGVVVLLGGLAAPWYMPPFLGEGWEQTGRFAQVLSFPLATQLIGGTLSNLITLGRNKLQAGWDVLRLLALIAVFSTAYALDWDPLTTLTAYAATRSGLYILLFGLNVYAIREHARSMT